VEQNGAQSTSPFPDNSRQMILVLAETWDSFRVRLYRCEKNFGTWRAVQCFPAVCGQKGMAWGLGVYPADPLQQQQPSKKEGDRKTPAGVFTLGACRGYASKFATNQRLSYQPLTVTTQGVDDPKSRYYNKIVDRAKLTPGQTADWDSYEVMRRDDTLYKWLVAINHNPANLPGYGSLIFMHPWAGSHTGTAGCTALSEPDLLELLRWLDPAREPVLIQMPREEYQKFRNVWGLPAVTAR
jgi:D-alanyl-D-alanine dipeptidase